MATAFGDTLRGIFGEVEAEEKRIKDDKALSPAGKAAKTRQVKDVAYARARELAAAEVTQRRALVARAREGYETAQRTDRARQDPVRAGLALQRAQIFAQNASWDRVQQAISDALRIGDRYDQQAWQDLMPVLHKRFGSDDKGLDRVIDAERSIFLALEAQEAPDVRATREAMEAAEVDLQTVLDDVGTVEFIGEYRGDMAMVSTMRQAVDGPQQAQVVATGESSWYITSGGEARGWL